MSIKFNGLKKMSETQDHMTPVCFISHAWKSGRQKAGGHKFGLRLAKTLRNFGIQIWIDEEQMPPGTPISPNVKAGIEHHSDVFLFILSKEALESINCMEELHIAIQSKKAIIVIVRDSCQIPMSLRDKIHLDCSDQAFDSVVKRLVEGITKLAREQRVIAALRDRDPDKRVEAARILSDLRHPQSVKIISDRVYEENDPDVKHWFLICLGTLADIGTKEREQVLSVLNAFRDHCSPRVRQGVEIAIAQIFGDILSTDEGCLSFSKTGKGKLNDS